MISIYVVRIECAVNVIYIHLVGYSCMSLPVSTASNFLIHKLSVRTDEMKVVCIRTNKTQVS